jgi:hypothetical protein
LEKATDAPTEAFQGCKGLLSLTGIVIKMVNTFSESHRLLCVCKRISAMIAACLTLHTGCTGGSEDAKPNDGQKGGKGEQTQAEQTAVVCTIDVTNKTACVLPWENVSRGIGDAASLKRDKPRILGWEESTQLVSEGNTITIAQCMQGEPLRPDCKRLTDLEGELTRLHIETVRGRDMVRKIEVLGAFDRDTISVRVGTNTVQAVGGPVKCDTHKITHSASPTQR